ncbi:MAG: ABC transporter ATP-binding protein [Ardenticatenaceae bacterium]|nr:ABC transporter ATP-binding protein [Ardenticatenaceae bacterium]
MLETEGLTKQFGGTIAVQNLDLHVRPGEIYGFLGPNGAGKTTTIYMLLGLIPPTAGRVLLFGQPVTPDALTLKRRIGVVAEEPVSATRMTAWELVRFFADLNGVPRPERRMHELFEALDLWDVRHSLAHDYSRGMRQKLSLIRALVHDPDLLVLDEPVSGLDPYGILQVRELVDAHRRRGGAVFISSHILSEIERSADRIGILHQGRLLAEDTMDGLRRRLAHGAVVELDLAVASPGLVSALAALPCVERLVADGRRVALHVMAEQDARPAIFQTVVAQGGVLVEMRTEEMSLEEAFVTITNSNVQQLVGAA